MSSDAPPRGSEAVIAANQPACPLSLHQRSKSSARQDLANGPEAEAPSRDNHASTPALDRVGYKFAMDLLIQNGDVIDGAGAPARQANVVVQGDRIVAIELGRVSPAQRVINAQGHVVAPRFIDIKTPFPGTNAIRLRF